MAEEIWKLIGEFIGWEIPKWLQWLVNLIVPSGLAYIGNYALKKWKNRKKLLQCDELFKKRILKDTSVYIPNRNKLYL
jgi:hypothetical protein